MTENTYLNAIASPGTDGLILLFYKTYWDDVGDLLHRMITENFHN